MEEPKPIPSNPCLPSPCGPNAQCKSHGDTYSCSCLPEFIGQPPYCRPECISNSECTKHLACLNQKCRDPCPSSCGFNAECHVSNHIPHCICLQGYVGNPFTSCSKPTRKRLYLRLKKLKRKRCFTN